MFARDTEVNDDFFVLQAGLLESNVSSVSPWAAVVSVEDDLGSGHCVVGDGIKDQMDAKDSGEDAIIYGTTI